MAADTLNGSSGNDVLIGGLENDTLSGGAGLDVTVVKALSTFGPPPGGWLAGINVSVPWHWN